MTINEANRIINKNNNDKLVQTGSSNRNTATSITHTEEANKILTNNYNGTSNIHPANSNARKVTASNLVKNSKNFIGSISNVESKIVNIVRNSKDYERKVYDRKPNHLKSCFVSSDMQMVPFSSGPSHSYISNIMPNPMLERGNHHCGNFIEINTKTENSGLNEF